MNNVATKAAESVTKATQQDLEKDLLGAWRAGYDWLHVYDPFPIGTFDDRTPYSVLTYTLPSNSDKLPDPDNLRYAGSYDLRELTIGDLEEAQAQLE